MSANCRTLLFGSALRYSSRPNLKSKSTPKGRLARVLDFVKPLLALNGIVVEIKEVLQDL